VVAHHLRDLYDVDIVFNSLCNILTG